MNCLLIIGNGKKNRQKKPRRAQINKKVIVQYERSVETKMSRGYKIIISKSLMIT